MSWLQPAFLFAVELDVVLADVVCAIYTISQTGQLDFKLSVVVNYCSCQPEFRLQSCFSAIIEFSSGDAFLLGEDVEQEDILKKILKL